MNKQIFKINIEPQNSSVYGTLRLIADVDCETVKSVEPIIGYSHRGLEKTAETKTYLQYLPITNQIDFLSGFMCQEAFCSAVEKLCNIQVPQNAQYTRVLLMELNRISSHLFWLGEYLKNLGMSAFYSFKEREMILKIFDEITGQKMLFNFHTFGGIKKALSAKNLSDTEDFLAIFVNKLDKYEKVLTDNPIFKSKTQKLGILSKNTALIYSITGANLRASGIKTDFRKANPYLSYAELDFDTPTETSGDCYSRYLIRMAEMRQSVKIAKQCVDYLKKDNQNYCAENINADTLTPEKGTAVSLVESSRGLICCTVISDGSEKPFRVKWRTGSFYSAQVLSELLKGRFISDITTIVGSLDILMSEADR